MALCRVSAFPFRLTKGKRSSQSALVSVFVGTPGKAHVAGSAAPSDTYTHTHAQTLLCFSRFSHSSLPAEEMHHYAV